MAGRSEFMLAFEGPPKKVAAMRRWIERKATTESDKVEKGHSYSHRSTFETLRDCREIENEGQLLYAHDYCKCYSPWSENIDSILLFARDNLGLDAAYARLGEDLQDQEFDNGDSLRIALTRMLNFTILSGDPDDHLHELRHRHNDDSHIRRRR